MTNLSPEAQTNANLIVFGAYFLLFWVFGVKIGSRGVQAHLKSLVGSNYADPQMESFWRRVGVEIRFLGPEPQLAMQNGGYII